MKGTLGKEKKKKDRFDFIIVDGMNISYKYYYGMQNLKNSNGIPTGLFHGFFQVVLKYLKESPNSRVIICWEGGKLSRAEKYDNYKSQRPKKQDEFLSAVKRLQDMMGMLGVEQKYMPGWEADDVAAVISNMAGNKKVLLISKDGDWVQLMRENRTILKKGKEFKYEKIEKELGFPPENIVIYKMLKGDISDNIKGIKGFPEELAKMCALNCWNLSELMNYRTGRRDWDKWLELLSENKIRRENKERLDLIRLKKHGELEELSCHKRDLKKLKKNLLELELFKVLNLVRLM